MGKNLAGSDKGAQNDRRGRIMERGEVLGGGGSSTANGEQEQTASRRVMCSLRKSHRSSVQTEGQEKINHIQKHTHTVWTPH